jgi:hypothetical protein
MGDPVLELTIADENIDTPVGLAFSLGGEMFVISIVPGQTSPKTVGSE